MQTMSGFHAWMCIFKYRTRFLTNLNVLPNLIFSSHNQNLTNLKLLFSLTYVVNKHTHAYYEGGGEHKVMSISTSFNGLGHAQTEISLDIYV